MGLLTGLIPGFDSEEEKPKSSGLFDDFFCTGSSSGNTANIQKEVDRRPLFGSGGIFDDQKKPANTQYNVLGHLCNNEQEVKNAINEESGYGNMGCYCPHCGLYHPNKASMLNCLCRKYR